MRDYLKPAEAGGGGGRVGDAWAWMGHENGLLPYYSAAQEILQAGRTPISTHSH